MTKTKATKTAHAAHLALVLNNSLRQCDMPDGLLSQNIVRTASKIFKCKHRQAKKKLGALKSRGATRAGLHRGTSGTFVAAPCPHPSTGLIMDPQPLAVLKKALLDDFDTIYLRSALSNKTGPKSKFLEIRTDNSIVPEAAQYHTWLAPYFPACRALLLQALTSNLHIYPHPIDTLPTIPFRIFACLYPAKTYSGMGIHRDTHPGYGALTLALTNDHSVDSSFFTAASMKASAATLPWPLLAGFAVAICPSFCHGVRAFTRPGHRLTITMFF